eukprot:15454779-Alexandrium_andersonii.AAC.1
MLVAATKRLVAVVVGIRTTRENKVLKAAQAQAKAAAKAAAKSAQAKAKAAAAAAQRPSDTAPPQVKVWDLDFQGHHALPIQPASLDPK